MRTLSGIGLISLGSLLFSVAPCRAQDTVELDSTRLDEVQHLMPIEVLGIRVNDRSPFAVSNIGRAEIARNNLGRDIPYVLDRLPSVTVTSDAGAGIGYTGIRIRGTDASRINFTINGIPVNDAESQAAIFVDFPDLLSSTGSIQVQRGVGSSTNGAGAFGASVNISNLQQSATPFAEIANSYGSFNTWKHTIKAGTGLLPGGFQFDVRLSKIHSDGYIERSAADLKSLQFIAGWTSRDKKTAVHFNLFTGKEKTGQAWNGVPEDSLATHRRFNGLGLKADGSYYKDQTDNYRQDYYQLFFDHEIGSYWQLHAGLFLTRGIGFYNEYRLNESFSDYGRPPFIMGNDTARTTNLTRRLFLDNYYYGLVYHLRYKKNKTNLIVGGAVTQYDGEHYGNVTWANYGFPVNYEWYHLPAQKSGFNIYGKLQQQIGLYWFTFADVQFRRVAYTIDGFRKNPEIDVAVDYNFINPKLGISYIKAHQGNAESKAYFSFAVANKEPNRDDFEAASGALPKPETLYDFEAGYQYKSERWDLAANLYYMLYHNQLIMTGKINDVGAYTRVNVPNSYRAGVELTAGFQTGKGIRLNANATFSSNKIRKFTEYIDDYDQGGQVAKTFSNTDIAFSPAVLAGAIASFEPFYQRLEQQHFFVDFIGKYVGKQFLDNTSNDNRTIPAYGLANIRLRYTVGLSFLEELGVSLALNNVLDHQYVSNGYTFSYISDGSLQTENYYFPQAGFNVLVGLSLRF